MCENRNANAKNSYAKMSLFSQFPVKQTTETESHYEVTLRGDCVYLDDDVTLQGLKKLRVHARKFVSNGQTLTLQVK